MPIIASKFESLKYSQDDIDNVRKYFNVNEKIIKQNVEILKNWLKQQQHLPQIADDDFLERMLLRNKFRIEQTKQKLDNYYTLRGLYPQYILENFNTILPSKEIRQILPLPKLTNSQERVIYMFKTDPDCNPDIPRCISLMCMVLEFLIYNDYNIGDKCLIDFKNVPFNDLQYWTITRLSHIFKLYTKAYTGRVRSIDIINPPGFINTFVNLFKLVLPDKLFSRIKIHNDMDSLYESVPRECLPSDLGGDLATIAELAGKFDEICVAQYEFFNTITKQTSNEKLRIGELVKDELYGIEGNFKKLDFD